jgi:hypothetical protein
MDPGLARQSEICNLQSAICNLKSSVYQPNEPLVLASIAPSDTVLDIGGWARPFNRANWVMDAEPYETRGRYGTPQGGERELFGPDRWIRRDICEHTPYPFGDKEIDFVVCSHTLEDVRDPLWVCAEMIRVGKRGYIEVPSREAESSRGVEPGQVGWSHHRWLIDIAEGGITFLMKYHTIHSDWRLSLPARHLRSLPEARHVQWLFWEGSFAFAERTIHGPETIAAELEGYVRRVRPYPGWLLTLDAGARATRTLGRRALGWIRRHA